MFKQLIIGSFILFSGAAQASPTVMALFSAIKATGTEIALDLPIVCSNKQLMGIYQYQHDVIDRLTICVSNHNGDNEELRDTVLHEAVHVAQTCNENEPLFTPVSIVKAADPETVLLLTDKYPKAQFVLELEARVIARDQDEVFVTDLIKKHCS